MSGNLNGSELRQRERGLERIADTSYANRLDELGAEVDILAGLEAERDPDYDVAAALAEVDALEVERRERERTKSAARKR
jgi:hypothetical protein